MDSKESILLRCDSKVKAGDSFIKGASGGYKVPWPHFPDINYLLWEQTIRGRVIL